MSIKALLATDLFQVWVGFGYRYRSRPKANGFDLGARDVYDKSFVVNISDAFQSKYLLGSEAQIWVRC